MRYMIHACPARLWYVNGYLLPSMLTQGIQRDDIVVWCDWDGVGNLQSFVESCRFCGKQPGAGVWHLQDDVVISRHFARHTRAGGGERIVCGFCFPVSDPCVNFRGENIPTKFIWYSFQCIYIPNTVAGEFAAWFQNEARHRDRYREKVADRKHDDWFFREFLMEKHPDGRVTNLAPNLVDHVDYLIGGTTLSPLRARKVNRAAYWEEPGLVEELEKQLKERRTDCDAGVRTSSQ